MALLLLFFFFHPQAFALDYDADFAQRYARYLQHKSHAARVHPSIPLSLPRDDNSEPAEIRALEGAAQFFANVINTYKYQANQDFTNLNDFRAQLESDLQKTLPNGLSSLFEAWQLTAIGPQRGLRTQGGSVGVRYDYRVNDHAQLNITVAPLAVEELSLIQGTTQGTVSSKILYENQIGVGGTYIFNGGTDAHARVVYEPQVLDFGDYQIYAEVYARFTVYKRTEEQHGTHLDELKLVPKAIYWNGNQDVSFFTVLEFHFSDD